MLQILVLVVAPDETIHVFILVNHFQLAAYSSAKSSSSSLSASRRRGCVCGNNQRHSTVKCFNGLKNTMAADLLVPPGRSNRSRCRSPKRLPRRPSKPLARTQPLKTKTKKQQAARIWGRESVFNPEPETKAIS